MRIFAREEEIFLYGRYYMFAKLYTCKQSFKNVCRCIELICILLSFWGPSDYVLHVPRLNQFFIKGINVGIFS